MATERQSEVAFRGRPTPGRLAIGARSKRVGSRLRFCDYCRGELRLSPDAAFGVRCRECGRQATVITGQTKFGVTKPLPQDDYLPPPVQGIALSIEPAAPIALSIEPSRAAPVQGKVKPAAHAPTDESAAPAARPDKRQGTGAARVRSSERAPRVAVSGSSRHQAEPVVEPVARVRGAADVALVALPDDHAAPVARPARRKSRARRADRVARAARPATPKGATVLRQAEPVAQSAEQPAEQRAEQPEQLAAFGEPDPVPPSSARSPSPHPSSAALVALPDREARESAAPTTPMRTAAGSVRAAPALARYLAEFNQRWPAVVPTIIVAAAAGVIGLVIANTPLN